MPDAPDPRPRLLERAPPHREFVLGADSVVVGRGAEADVRIEHEDVSRRHVRITVRDDGLIVRDLGSKNGLFINGRRVSGEGQAGPGDVVGLGAVEFQVVHPAARVGRALADAGEPTITRVAASVVEPEAPPRLWLPLLGVALFGALLAALLLLS